MKRVNLATNSRLLSAHSKDIRVSYLSFPKLRNQRVGEIIEGIAIHGMQHSGGE